MTDQQTSGDSSRAAAIGAHLAVVGTSFVLSLILVPMLVPFDPEGAGATASACGVLLVHGLAGVISLLRSRVSFRSCFVVFGIAFCFTGCVSVEALQRWAYQRYQAPYDRFRDYLASPIPPSVANLRFVPLEEQISPELMLRFDISPEDLGLILARLGMKRVEPKALPNPKDFFQYPYYLPIDDEDFELYQAKDSDGEVLTIKTNKSHAHAIFRKESSGMYRDRDWENRPKVWAEMDAEALEKMKRRYEAARKRR